MFEPEKDINRRLWGLFAIGFIIGIVVVGGLLMVLKETMVGF